MFGTYLSPNLVNKMIESGEEPTLGGIDAEITAFFSDVQGFSAFSEILTPQQLVALMNEYLSGMTDILMESGCYVDKYIGDAIVGIFNAPVPSKSTLFRPASSLNSSTSASRNFVQNGLPKVTSGHPSFRECKCASA